MPSAHLTLTIDSGNDAMQTPADIADALVKVADTIRGYADRAAFGGPIHDLNGNQVGHYHGNGNWGDDNA